MPTVRPMLRETALSFFLCGRNASASLVAFSIIASCIGGTATLAMMGLAARAGWPAFWWLGGGGIGLAILGLALAKRIRATHAATLPEVIHLFQDARCSQTASLHIAQPPFIKHIIFTKKFQHTFTKLLQHFEKGSML